MNKLEIGHLIEERRDKLGLNQGDLAEMTGITTKTIYLIETGKGNPSIDTLQKLLTVVGLEMIVQIKKTDE